MPLYRNPDFRRLPSGLACAFDKSSADSFFALPAWYDLMARYGVPKATEIRAYTAERAAPPAALLTQTTTGNDGRNLASLTNAHSLEHGLLHAPGADLETSLATILSQILAERPRWDCLSLSELDPREPSYAALVGALRRAGLLVESCFSSGTWYEETAGLSFPEYVAARPSELRNTWRRKRRRLERGNRLTTSFVDEDKCLDKAVADYETVYAASWKPPELYPDFVPALMRLASKLRALRLGIYYLDGIPAAAQFWILWKGRAVICKLAHDKRFDDLSLGTLLTMEMFERVLTDDRPREISLGRGDDPYKKLWLPKRRERWGITAANPRTWRGLRFGMKRQAAMLYHRLRRERLAPLG
ncbi:MAG: GNAT family N-acetyltransferase [Stellaceae bacterium]